jgi:hypothetical protein
MDTYLVWEHELMNVEKLFKIAAFNRAVLCDVGSSS